MMFDLLTLEEATEHFADKNKLGEGGFGIVYKVGNQVITQEKHILVLHPLSER